MISQELYQFCERWFQKEQEYQNQDIQNYFDKFFTIYVVYNRLYKELTLSWVRIGKIKAKGFQVSDSAGAKEHVHNYLGTDVIWTAINNDHNCLRSVTSICALLENHVFYIKLDRLTGEPKPEEDQKLLDALNSGDHDKIVKALLDIIYSIRCNMFHGHKGFDRIQIDILSPVNTLLEKITKLLFEKLANDNEVGMLPVGQHMRQHTSPQMVRGWGQRPNLH
jgi:hypothetical protein